MSGCSPTWTVQYNKNIPGGMWSGAGSITDCRNDCNFNASCTSIDWVNSAATGQRCWLHGYWSARMLIANHPGVDHHVISRNCGQLNISPSPSSSLLPPPSQCSTVVLQCYRRQAIPMEQAKIRPAVTLNFLYRSLPNLIWLITSVTPKILHYKSRFSLKTRINLVVSATKIRSRIGKSP